MKTCVVIAVATFLAAFTAAAQDVPKVGVYLGYDYVRFNSATNIPAFSANGGGGQLVVNFNHWFSAVADLGAVHNGNIHSISLDSTFANFLFGPRFTIRKSRVQPYFQILWGGVYAATSTQITGQAFDPVTLLPEGFVTARARASQTAFAMTAGGGIDIRISRHLSFRPIGLDYYLTRLQNLRTQGDNNQNNLRYSTGFTFLFGGEKPAPVAHRVEMRTCLNGTSVPIDQPCPKENLTVALTATPSEVCQGETAKLTPSVSGGAADQISYAWSVNGQTVGQGTTYDFNSSDHAPGSYKVELSAGGDAFNPATGEAMITVREYRPPAGQVQASPAQIRAGDKASLSASFQNQCGGSIGATNYSASEGAVQGDQFDSSSIQWDASNSGEQRKTVTITAKAADSRNTGTAATTVEVVKSAAPPPPPAAVRLPDVLFPANNSRVNNCGKRILLEQLRSYYERDSSGTVVMVGHESSDEKAPALAQKRALNSALVVTAGKGVCLSIPATQVDVSSPGANQNGVSFEDGFCKSSVGVVGSNTSMRRVEVWFVPTGGVMPPSATGFQAASALNLGSLACPK